MMPLRPARCRRSLVLALLPCLLVTALLTAGCRTDGPPHTVILVTIDTLRADHLPSFGYPRALTPFLSKLGDRGVLFERAMSSCSHTAPSHASIFTGLHPPQHRVLENGQPLDPALITLAEVFAHHGYATGGVTTAGFLSGLGQGFDHYVVAHGYHPAPWIVDRGLEWLDGLDPTTPAFLWLHLFDVHEWHVADRVDAKAREALPAVDGLHGAELVEFIESTHGDPLRYLGSRRELLRIADAYDAQILAVDRELARFARGLTARRQGGDVVWVVTADHGEGLGNHGLRGHGKNVYQEQLHVPLIVAASDGRWEPHRVPSLVQLVDLAPTLTATLGVPLEGGSPRVAGRSMIPLLEGDPAAWQQRPAFSMRRPVDARRLRRGWLPGEVFSLRRPRWKVIVRTEGDSELYDLHTDPYEQTDLSHRRSGTLERLRRLASATFARLREDGETVQGAPIAPEHIEELKALGYL